MFNLFFGNNDSIIPEALEMRTEDYSMMLIGILALSFLLLTLSRLFNGKSVATVSSVFFKNSSIEQILKENMRLTSLSSILLVLNYFICFSLCCFLFFNRILLLDSYWALLLAILIPIIFFLIESFGLFVVGWLTNEQKRLASTLINSTTGNQFIGLLFSILALFWIMNPEFNKFFLGIFLGLFCLKYLTRLLKNSIIVLTNGVSWYYLILYFCTLEILPLFVAYYYIMKNFNI